MDDERVPDPGVVPSPPRRPLSYDDLDLGDLIGRGGNADVRIARATAGDESIRVAVKEPRFEGTLDRDAVDRFERRIEAWAELDDHDHVVGVVDWDSRPVPWLALEYMDGGSLADRLAATDGGLPPARAAWIGTRVASAVRHAHRHGVAHLDLKPANVLLREVDGSWDVPKVTDWGLARLLLDDSGSVEGLSPAYAAPEQFDADGHGDPDDFTDIYGVGALVYELLTGRPPFEGSAVAVMRSVLNEEPTPPTEIADVPPVADEVLGRALATDKDDRHETAVHLRDDLERLYEMAVDGEDGASGGVMDADSGGGADTDSGGGTNTDSGGVMDADSSGGADTDGDASAEFDWPHSRSGTEEADDGEVLSEFEPRPDEAPSTGDVSGEEDSTVSLALRAAERRHDLDDPDWTPVFAGLDIDPPNRYEPPCRLPVRDAGSTDGEPVVRGRVERGSLSALGGDLRIQPAGVTAGIRGLTSNGSLADSASAGDEVTLGLEGVDPDALQRGDVCGPVDDPPATVESFTVRLHVLDHPSVITAGYTPVVHAHTAQVACSFETLHTKQPADGGTSTADPEFVESGEVVEATLEPQEPFAVEPFDTVPETGAVAVRDMGQPVAVGVVTDVTPK